MNRTAAKLPSPIVIAHRGASGYLPEHTLAGYFLAAEMGADYIEPDLVMTRDAVLVARHENEISATTDVARHARFADRRRTRSIDGREVSGWFTEDFTLAELKSLRARERLPALRPANTRSDGVFEIPTFDEVLTLARSVDRLRAQRAAALGLSTPARLGVYPETKHPSYFAQLGLPMERAVLTALERHGFGGGDAMPAVIQSFETSNLRELRAATVLPLVQLIEASGQPWDLTARGDSRSYADLLTPGGLREIATYADAIGVPKSAVLQWSEGPAGAQARPLPLVAQAHEVGLQVHVWTFRAENEFLPVGLRRGTDAAQRGDIETELAAALSAGIDGLFIDQPELGVAACRRAAQR